jgi:isopropylmalate/homocitrate/citramalate synthase
MKIKGIGEKSSEEFFSNLIRLITRLKKAGLTGIEVSHPSASPEDTERLVDISHRTGLKITMGSDYHGPQNKKRA